MLITFIVLALAAVFFVWGKIRSDVVAVCALVVLMLFGVLTPEEALSGFSNSIVIMMVGLFIIGGGIFQTGLAKMISTRILKFAGNSELKLFVLIMLATAFMGSFVSNTGTVALMLPVVISLAVSAGINSRRLLMPLAFASSMGGMNTLIGTPPNMIINDTLVNSGIEKYKEGLSFFSFLPIGLIAISLGIFSLWFMSRWLVSSKKNNADKTPSKKESLKKLMQKYQLSDNLYRVWVNENSSLINKNLKELSVNQRFDVTILEIRRDVQKRFFRTVNQDTAGASSMIHLNDVLYIFGSFENVQRFVQECNLSLIEAGHAESKNQMEFGQTGIAEIVILPGSKTIGKEIKELDFRNLYNVNILGIQRHQEYILQNIKDEKIYPSDVLLVQGKWKDIHKLSYQDDEWLLIGQPLEEEAKIPLKHKAPIAAFIMVAMVLTMVFNVLPPVTAVIIAAVLMVLTGCLRSVEAAYKTINWESIVLFAGMIPISIAMEKTGASTLISDGIVGGLGGFGAPAVLTGIYLTTSVLTLFISNTATAVLFAPIALRSAISLGVSPVPFLFAVTVAASMCFASPFSTPPNALVMSAGRYSFMDYVKVGLPLQLIYAVVMIVVIPLIFPY